MGLFDFLKTRPAQERFAEIARRRLGELGVEGEVSFDPESFRLRVGTQHVFLANLYEEYVRAWPWRRKAILDRFLAVMLGAETAPSDFMRARKNLVPVLRSPVASESVRVHVAINEGKDLPPFAERPFAGEYSLCLVYDTPKSMSFINEAQLEEWKVPFDRAMEYAVENLERASPPAFTSPARGVFVSAWKDNYDPSRLLLTQLVRALPVRGRPVAALPHRDCLILTGDEDEDGLTTLAELVTQEMKAPRTIGAVPIVLDGEEWRALDPAGTSRAAIRLRRLVREGRGSDYAEQKDLLERLHEKNGEDVFVASYSGMVNEKSGELLTFATWTKGVPTLLPRTDLVALVSLEEDSLEPEGPAVLVGWEDLLRCAGSLLQPTRHFPVRFKVNGFPEGEAMSSLRAASEARRSGEG